MRTQPSNREIRKVGNNNNLNSKEHFKKIKLKKTIKDDINAKEKHNL